MRRKVLGSFAALCTAITLVITTGFAGSAASAATSTGPTCTFNGSTFPLLFIKPGGKVQLSCKGLPALHPYLLMEVSLLLAIDPAAAPLLKGQITSVAGLEALLAALPIVNPAAITLPFSDLSGNLNFTYTVPTSQAPDPNASCPPSKEQFNSGLLGCALAMIDLTSIKPVAAGSALLEYPGFPLFPPDPTAVVSPTTAKRGSTVSVRDAPLATRYWWLSTLLGMQSDLSGGGGSPPPVTVSVGPNPPTRSKVSVTNASYNGKTFTPPKMSGTFVVPSHAQTGRQPIYVDQSGNVEGFSLAIVGTAHLTITP